MEARSRTHAAGVHEIDVAACTGKPGTSPYTPGKAPGTGDAELTTP